MKRVFLVLVCFLLAVGASLGVATAGEAWAASDNVTGEATDLTPFQAKASAIDVVEAEKLQSTSGCPLGNPACAPRNIINSFSGLCLNVLNFGQNNGDNVVQATNCSISSSKWSIYGGINAYEVSALHSGQCLNVLDSSQHNGANVVQAQVCNALNSHWIIVPVGWQDGRRLYILRAKHSNQCLNVLNWAQYNGANVVQAVDCSQAPSRWFIEGA